MRITLPIANRQSLEFASLEALAQHFGLIADSYRSSARENEAAGRMTAGRFDTGKAETYDIICWQLHGIKIEM